MRFDSSLCLVIVSCSTLLLGCGPDAQPDGTHLIGFESDRGKVTAVAHVYDDCWLATYEVSPEWQCSAGTLREFGVNDSDSAGNASGAPGSAIPGVSQDVLLEQALTNAPQLETTSCDDLVTVYREKARVSAELQLTQAVISALRSCEPTIAYGYIEEGREVASCVPEKSVSFWGSPQDTGSGGAASYDDATQIDYSPVAGGPEGNQVDGSSPSEAGAEHYSSTNHQVAAVEEADYVKNDAGHIFVLSDVGVRIFDSWPVEETAQIAVISLEGRGRRLLLAEDRLIVFSTTQGPEMASNQGCTYGYDCRAQAESGATRIQVFAVSDPAHPKLESTVDFDAGYLAARRIDETVHLVLHSGAQVGIPSLGVDFTPDAESAEDLLVWQESRSEEIVDKAQALDADVFLPQLAQGCDDALTAPGGSATSMITLASFQLDAPQEISYSHIATDAGFVYASESNLYLVTDGLGAGNYGFLRSSAEDISMVHRFALSEGGSRYEGSAPIRGHVLNQFSMDEYEGVLRIASTSGWVPDTGVNSTVTTMGLLEGRLSRLGELTGLAPTEDIRSVRFDGDRGFVVTFKKTDPLFVFDLKDVKQPAVLGELKIPGFSTYMHPLDRDHLLAVGFDADDQGSFAYFQGIQIQMFDVSDLANPTLLHKTVLGGRGSSSEALMNHLAFNYFPSRKMLAMPVTICDDGAGGGGFSGQLQFSGVIAFDIDVDTGITERGRLSFGDASAPRDYGSVSCFDWWSNSSSAVKRTIFFDDYLVALSDYELRAGQVDALQDILVNLPLVEGSTEPVSLFESSLLK